MDRLKRWREPAAWAVLGALVLNLLAVLLGALSYGLSNAAVAYRLASPTTLVALAALVASCVLVEPTPRARLLAQLGTVVGVAAVLLSLVMTVVAAAGRFALPVVDVITLLSGLVVPGLAAGVLLVLWRIAPAQTVRPALDQPTAARDSEPTAPLVRTTPVDPPTVPDTRVLPTWAPDAAAGAVWRTAGDAAAGAPATGWGTAGSPTGRGWSLPDREPHRGSPADNEPTVHQPRPPTVPPPDG